MIGFIITPAPMNEINEETDKERQNFLYYGTQSRKGGDISP